MCNLVNGGTVMAFDRSNYMVSGMIEYATRVLPYEREEEAISFHLNFIKEEYITSASTLSDEDLSSNICYLEDTKQYISDYLNFIQVLSKSSDEVADKRESFLRHALMRVNVADNVVMLGAANEAIAIGLDVLGKEKNKRDGVKQQSLKPRG